MVKGVDARTDDLSIVLFFLLGAEDQGITANGHHAAEAFNAFCRMHRVDPDGVRASMRKGQSDD